MDHYLSRSSDGVSGTNRDHYHDRQHYQDQHGYIGDGVGGNNRRQIRIIIGAGLTMGLVESIEAQYGLIYVLVKQRSRWN